MIEGKYIEWKSSWKDEYLKWICGFANAQGGLLEVGKNNKGEVIGISNSSKLLEILPNKISSALGVITEIDLVKLKGKDLILIKVKPYPHPVSYKGQYYYRSGSTKPTVKRNSFGSFYIRKNWENLGLCSYS